MKIKDLIKKLQELDDEMYCDNCGKEFSYVRNIEITYSSYKLD